MPQCVSESLSSDIKLGHINSVYSLKYCFTKNHFNLILIFAQVPTNESIFLWFLDKNFVNYSCSIKKIRSCSQICLFVFCATPPPQVGQGLLLHEVSRSHTTKRYIR